MYEEECHVKVQHFCQEYVPVRGPVNYQGQPGEVIEANYQRFKRDSEEELKLKVENAVRGILRNVLDSKLADIEHLPREDLFPDKSVLGGSKVSLNHHHQTTPPRVSVYELPSEDPLCRVIAKETCENE